MKYLPLLLIIFAFMACPEGIHLYGNKYNEATLPDIPVNFDQINSEYDDYNSTAPFFRDVFPLCFSSNRNSNGEQMDIIYKLVAVNFDKETGELRVYNETNSNLDVTIRTNKIHALVNKVHSNQNELGPNVISLSADEFLMLYATEVNGNLDVRFIHDRSEMHDPMDLNFINSDFDDAYPCFDETFENMYFCSDRSGNFDIYFCPLNPNVPLEENLSDSISKPVNIAESLNSENQDKCPFIDEEIMVFASDRPGGYGGFDLYYSKWINGNWTEPVNFGASINSPYDEYRPILRNSVDFTSRFMLFSSNRPGGKGGFDLYYLGVNF